MYSKTSLGEEAKEGANVTVYFRLKCDKGELNDQCDSAYELFI